MKIHHLIQSLLTIALALIFAYFLFNWQPHSKKRPIMVCPIKCLPHAFPIPPIQRCLIPYPHQLKTSTLSILHQVSYYLLLFKCFLRYKTIFCIDPHYFISWRNVALNRLSLGVFNFFVYSNLTSSC